MLCLPGFGTHANTQNLPHFRAFPASVQEHSPPKCLFFMANEKLPNRPGFALLQGGDIISPYGVLVPDLYSTAPNGLPPANHPIWKRITGGGGVGACSASPWIA